MDTTSSIHPIQDPRLTGGLAVAIAAAALAVANFTGDGGNGGAGPYAVSLAVVAMLAVVLFGRVLPGTADPARAGWILAAVGLATCVVFWSGLPFVLGAAAAYCGARAGRGGPIALGGLAIVIAVVGCFIG